MGFFEDMNAEGITGIIGNNNNSNEYGDIPDDDMDIISDEELEEMMSDEIPDFDEYSDDIEEALNYNYEELNMDEEDHRIDIGEEPEIIREPISEDIPKETPVIPKVEIEIPEKSVEIVKKEKKEPISSPISTVKKKSNDTVLTFIPEGTLIAGNIESNAAIELHGKIEGNVWGHKHVSIEKNAIVTGNVAAGTASILGIVKGDLTIEKDLILENNKITGNITVKGTANLKDKTVVIGNVSASNLVLSGAIKGDIDVKGPITLQSTAVVKGNIKCASLAIEFGAVIDGTFDQCYADKAAFNMFEE